MATSVANVSDTPYQPFQCGVCQSRFTRHENLKRHAALHYRSQGNGWLPCEYCTASFSRADLRHRHVRRKHPEHGGKPIARAKAKASQKLPGSPQDTSRNWVDSMEIETETAAAPSSSRLDQVLVGRDNQDYPTDNASGPPEEALSPSNASTASEIASQDVAANYQASLVGGSPGHSGHLDTITQPVTNPRHGSFPGEPTPTKFNPPILDNPSPTSPPLLRDNWAPSPAQVSRGCDLFFDHVACFLPFLHRTTFDASQAAPHLLLSLLCLAYQYGEDPEAGGQAGTGAILSRRCFQAARALIASAEDEEEDSIPHISLVQSYLLLQICAMMYFCGKDSAYGLKMHSKMIFHIRVGGLMQSVQTDARDAGDLESLWKDFIETESLKRTVFAVHQIDALWYQILSIPRQLSHLEIKCDLPCAEQLWKASSAAEWAHQQLTSRQSGPLIKYQDAVRRFLSPEDGLASLPAFDPYGAINVTQFLISSAREISGWCTMSGRISLDRVEPLKESLSALGLFFHQQPGIGNSTNSTLFEITWQSALIEYQVWSPSHVSGIVACSVDSLLKQATCRSPHTELLCDPSIVSAVQPHVNWFLHYLDSTTTPHFEAPWVTIYAYRAFLIAWQLLCSGTPGSMEAIGIADGDVEGALAWAHKVFQRRERWQLGRLVIECLDSLEV